MKYDLENDTRFDLIADLGDGLEIWQADVDALREQQKNARVMDPKTFNRLTENIARDGRLEQLPFCAAIGDGTEPVTVEIISGHHRIRSARAAGKKRAPILVDVTGLTRSQIVSKQLSHNAIQGKDDDDILAQLFTEMDNLEDMISSHVDPEKLGISPPLDAESLQPISVDFEGKTVVLTFLPSQIEDFLSACNTIPRDAALVNVLPMETYEKFQQTMKSLGHACDIRSLGAILSKMCDIAQEFLQHFEPDEEGRADTAKPKQEKIDQTIKAAKKPAEKAIAAMLEARRQAELNEESDITEETANPTEETNAQPDQRDGDQESHQGVPEGADAQQ